MLELRWAHHVRFIYCSTLDGEREARNSGFQSVQVLLRGRGGGGGEDLVKYVPWV